jgi:ATP-binding cassette subfamily F protein uup
VIVAEGEGNWREFVGGYSDWERVRDTVAASAKPVAKPAAKAEPAPAAAAAKGKKLSFKEQRELDELPKLIAALEDEQTALALQLSDPDFYKKNAAEAKRVNQRVEEIEGELLAALEKWEQIEARAKG